MSQSDLSQAQAVCKSQKPAAVAENITPDKVREWASLGKDFSNAIVDTAKGLGQSANEFLFTPVGIIIAFYFMWSKIGGIILGIPLLIGSWWLYYFICKKFDVTSIDYENVPMFWGAFTVRKVKSITYHSRDAHMVWLLLPIPTILLNLIILSSFIFAN